MKRRPGRIRTVFDCNTLIQVVAFEESPSAACLSLVESGEIELFISKPTMAELRRVLEYPEVLAISPHMTPERIARFLRWLTFRATLLRRVPHVWDYPRDPHDEPYLDLADAAEADFLVTRDKDLLSLMTAHAPIARQFRRGTHPLRVLDPVGFLKALSHS